MFLFIFFTIYIEYKLLEKINTKLKDIYIAAHTI